MLGHMTGWDGWIRVGTFGCCISLVAMGIVSVAMLAHWLLGSLRQQDDGEDRALAVLKMRFARG
jgi:uncharacterized membrane protein